LFEPVAGIDVRDNRARGADRPIPGAAGVDVGARQGTDEAVDAQPGVLESPELEAARAEIVGEVDLGFLTGGAALGGARARGPLDDDAVRGEDDWRRRGAIADRFLLGCRGAWGSQHRRDRCGDERQRESSH
jgi:hypothetical protein